MVGSDRLNAPAIDTFSHEFQLFHIDINSASCSWLGCVHCKYDIAGDCSVGSDGEWQSKTVESPLCSRAGGGG